VPFTSVRLGKSTFQITTSVGHSLHTYDLSRGLRLIFLSRPRTPELITATFAWKNLVFAAWGGLRSGKDAGVWIFRRGERVAALKMPPSLLEPIKQLLVFGSWIVGCCDKSIHVWKLGSHEHYATLTGSSPQMATEAQVFTGTICNMPTYVNKIFAGRADGYVDVWNVRSGRLLYSIPPSSPTEGPVTALQSTPVLSTLAIAYKSGIVSIYNVEFGRRILRFNDSASHKSRVTSIGFRTDGIGAGRDGKDAGVMATSTADSGDIVLWDLNRGGRKVGILRGAHEIKRSSGEGGINRIEFLDCQPVLISSGADNTLRSWIFDESPFSPIPRPLHTRQGHSESVTTLQFLPSSSESADAVGKWILSAAKDRALLALSLRKDSQNAELSQGNVRSKINKMWPGPASTETGSSEDFKAPEIVALACSLNRDGGFGWRSSQPVWTNSRGVDEKMPKTDQWESIVTAHRGDKWARTWFWGRKRAGRWAFETGDGTSVKVCNILNAQPLGITAHM
jgi:U3 small nucleolar RNA-associated protein 21